MTFHIAVNDHGIVDVAFIGPQTEQTVNDALTALQPYLDELRFRNQPILILIDNGRMNRATIAANQRVLKAIKELPYRKMAGINANPIIRLIVNAIIATAGVGQRVKLFESRLAAEDWLLKT